VPAAALPVTALVAGVPVLLSPGSALATAAYTVTFAGLVVLAWLSVRSRPRAAVLGHALVASALTAWLLGDLLYQFLSWRYGELGDVSFADLLWILGYPLLAAGLVRMTASRAPGRLREGLLDGLAMATVVASLFCQFMVLPALAAADLSGPAVAAQVFYPFGDVLLFAAAAMLALSPGRRGAPTRYLIAALALTFAGDVAISVAALVWPDLDTSFLDAVLLLANSLVAAALWHRDADQLTRPHTERDERLHPARVVYLGVALLALPALAGVRSGGGLGQRVTLLCSAAMLTVIVLIRFTAVVRESERARAALAFRATHDQLTGLVNRPTLHAALDVALERGAGAGPVVHFLDLDGFKAVNDRYGHEAGDLVLVAVAERLRRCVRAGDTVGRLGGDEFVVVSADAGGAEALADRLRAAVAAPIPYGPAMLQVGVSIGTADAGRLEDPTSDAVLRAADAAMYRVKTRRAFTPPAAAPIGS
jgi:diguanylate cyclase (GGDEF)-like protein